MPIAIDILLIAGRQLPVNMAYHKNGSSQSPACRRAILRPSPSLACHGPHTIVNSNLSYHSPRHNGRVALLMREHRRVERIRLMAATRRLTIRS